MEQNPMAKYDLANRYGGQPGKRRGQEGDFQNTGNQARDARRAAMREQRPQTFAEMQEQGMARPAPFPATPANGAQMFTGPEASARTVQSVTYGGQTYTPPIPANATPRAPVSIPAVTGTNTSVYDRLRESALNNLRASFSGQRQNLNEDLARRGLWASSGELGAGARLGDLAGQQARAEADLEANLLGGEREAEQRYLQMMLDLARMFQTGGTTGAGGI